MTTHQQPDPPVILAAEQPARELLSEDAIERLRKVVEILTARPLPVPMPQEAPNERAA